MRKPERNHRGKIGEAKRAIEKLAEEVKESSENRQPYIWWSFR